MDLKSKKLLYLLDLNSREKESVLAGRLKSSKQVVNNKIKKLERDGVIKKFQAILNLESLGMFVYANIYFKLANVTKKKEEEIFAYLLKDSRVGYVAQIGGRFDLSIVLAEKNIQNLEKQLDRIVRKFPNELRNYSVSLRTEGLKFPKKYLIDEKIEYGKQVFSKINEVVKVDALDVKILKELSGNSRLFITDIGERLGVPFSTVRLRIKSLEKKGVIAGYSLLFDLKSIGIQNYKLFIKTKDKSKEAHDRLLNYARLNKNITWFFKTFGEHDYEFRIEIESQERYQEVVRNLRTEFSGVIEDVETVFVFKELKEDFSVFFI